MQAAHQGVMENWEARGIEPAPIGIGIATGEMTVGEMGCAKRTDYTVIGRAANLGARLCGVAGGGEVLVSQTTYDLVNDQVAAMPITGLQLKGMGRDTTAYRISHLLE
jgi:adenylate cyclase